MGFYFSFHSAKRNRKPLKYFKQVYVFQRSMLLQCLRTLSLEVDTTGIQEYHWRGQGSSSMTNNSNLAMETVKNIHIQEVFKRQNQQVMVMNYTRKLKKGTGRNARGMSLFLFVSPTEPTSFKTVVLFWYCQCLTLGLEHTVDESLLEKGPHHCPASREQKE